MGHLTLIFWIALAAFGLGSCRKGNGKSGPDLVDGETDSSGGTTAPGGGFGGVNVPLRPSCSMRGAVVGERVLIAGGDSDGTVTIGGAAKKDDEVLDGDLETKLAGELAVLDAVLGDHFAPLWSTLTLEEPRRGFAMVTHGSKVFIGGGQRPKRDFVPGQAYDFSVAMSDQSALGLLLYRGVLPFVPPDKVGSTCEDIVLPVRERLNMPADDP